LLLPSTGRQRGPFFHSALICYGYTHALQIAAGRNVKARVYIAINAILSAASLSVDFGFAVQVAPFRQ